MATKRVLIAGGGIAGLSLSLALREGPWHVELVERGTGWDQPGAGLAVQPNAMRVLRCLGVGAAVEAAGTVIGRFGYYDQHGAPLCDIDLGDVWPAVGPFVGISRAALHDVLRSGSGRCRLGTAVTAVTQDGRSVSVSFGDGTVAGYDLVVGADGINSDVRRLVFGGPAPAYAGQMAWRSLAPVRPRSLDGVQFWLGDDRFFGLCPVGDGVTYGFGNIACARRHEPAAVAAFGARRRPRVEWVREQSQALTDLVRLPASVRDRGLRDRGVIAFHDRYRPLVAAP